MISRWKDVKIKINPQKCSFIVKEIEFLGMIISSEGVRNSSERLKQLKIWKSPKDLKSLREVMSLLNWLRYFVSNFADKVIYISLLLSSNMKFN